MEQTKSLRSKLPRNTWSSYPSIGRRPCKLVNKMVQHMGLPQFPNDAQPQSLRPGGASRWVQKGRRHMQPNSSNALQMSCGPNRYPNKIVRDVNGEHGYIQGH